MAITTRSDQQDRARGDGARVRELSLSPPSRRVRVPELAIGLLVIVLFALGAILWHLRSVDRTPVLAVASEVDRGEVIEASDLRVVYVASDDELGLRSSESNRIIGMTAQVDLAPGTLVGENLVAPAIPVREGDGVVGLPLDPGQFPAFDLAPGDRVNVVRIGSSESTSREGRGGSGAVLVRAVEVTAVENLAGGERKLVSVLASEEDADSIASVDSASVRLVLVSP